MPTVANATERTKIAWAMERIAPKWATPYISAHRAPKVMSHMPVEIPHPTR